MNAKGSSVTVSEAKGLVHREILRFAQDDSRGTAKVLMLS
jgi:hypothetical protein